MSPVTHGGGFQSRTVGDIAATLLGLAFLHLLMRNGQALAHARLLG